MRDGLKFFPMKKIAHAVRIPQIELMDLHVRGHAGQIGAFDLRIVKVVEVIEDRDFMTGSEQFLNQMRTDKTCAAGD